MTIRSFLRNDGQFKQVDAGSISISTTTTTAFLTYVTKATTFVSLVLTTVYQDGPSVAQGSSGTWFASGTVTLNSSAGNFMRVKMWDGATVIAGTTVDPVSLVGAGFTSVALSGIMAAPAGNLRMSARVDTGGAGSMTSTGSEAGDTFQSIITAIRIG